MANNKLPLKEVSIEELFIGGEKATCATTQKNDCPLL